MLPSLTQAFSTDPGRALTGFVALVKAVGVPSGLYAVLPFLWPKSENDTPIPPPVWTRVLMVLWFAFALAPRFVLPEGHLLQSWAVANILGFGGHGPYTLALTFLVYAGVVSAVLGYRRLSPQFQAYLLAVGYAGIPLLVGQFLAVS